MSQFTALDSKGPTQEKIGEIWSVVETKLSEVIGSYIMDGDGAALLVADLPMLTPPLCHPSLYIAIVQLTISISFY